MCNKSREEIVLGYKPDEAYKSVSTYVENPDGTSKFTITLDATSTECFPNLETHMKDLLCDRSKIEVKRILEELMASGSIDETKTKREIMIEYRHEKIPEPEPEDIPFVDQTAEELQTTKEELQSEKNKVASLDKRVGDLENNVETLGKLLKEERDRFQVYVTRYSYQMMQTFKQEMEAHITRACVRISNMITHPPEYGE